MATKKSFFNRIPNSNIFILILIIILGKVFLYSLVKTDIFSLSIGGGSDANTYDSYAKGYINRDSNLWFEIVRHLYNAGFYSREVISYLYFLTSLTFIPIYIARLADLKFKLDQKYYLYIFLVVSIYPTIFFYTWDIYRDIFMILCFLIGCGFVKKFIRSTKLGLSILYFSLAILMGYIMYGLRVYLGAAFLMSVFLWNIKLTKRRFYFFGILYLIVLFVLNYVGVLDMLTEYRAGFEDNGGSTLGLDFSNPILFIPNLILSMSGQLFGLYITNPLAIIVFIIETIPFMFMTFYIVKNIKLADSFVRFLIVFFILYASVWLIGNDNLGTSLRLRFFNYIVVYICFFYILKTKKDSS